MHFSLLPREFYYVTLQQLQRVRKVNLMLAVQVFFFFKASWKQLQSLRYVVFCNRGSEGRERRLWYLEYSIIPHRAVTTPNTCLLVDRGKWQEKAVSIRMFSPT